MFRRLIIDHSAAIFTLTAFITAVCIYCAISWRALWMKRSQLEHLGNLPFEVDTPAAAAPPPVGGPAAVGGDRAGPNSFVA